ncbi:MAG: outer membrane lipoprotein-sorting protein [Crocinitomicaceae bacterium]|jgi:outer membrane lipoprotein-sorting protein
MKKILLSLAVLTLSATTYAQDDATVESILDTYFENIGGREAWSKLEGHKISAEVEAQGMTIPLEIYALKDGRTITRFSVMGMDLAQGAFDGEVSWSTNFMSMEPEKSDAETTANTLLDSKDYPDPFLNYKANGYSVELMEEDMVDGVECYKLKLTKSPHIIDGEEVENVQYYFFDKENFVPVQVEQEINSGEMKGQTSVTVFSDYQEVEGLYFPFSVTQKIKDGEGQTVEFSEIELNPEVEDEMFHFPEE